MNRNMSVCCSAKSPPCSNSIECRFPFATLLKRQDLHSRLVNGSDYPLPAINSLIWTRSLVRSGFITAEERQSLNEIYDYNPLLFDFCAEAHDAPSRNEAETRGIGVYGKPGVGEVRMKDKGGRMKKTPQSFLLLPTAYCLVPSFSSFYTDDLFERVDDFRLNLSARSSHRRWACTPSVFSSITSASLRHSTPAVALM